jgi:hypothetical protein
MSHFYAWKQDDKHIAMLESAVARGELLLEEKVLLEADSNPRMAFELLKEKQRKEEKKEERDVSQTKSVWDIMQKSGEQRGVIVDAQIIDEVLK